ncbi:MAG TPA: methyltransferase domain-containing protein [bacterium]|nr:methyltransferase domain-containing protein [bacterium]
MDERKRRMTEFYERISATYDHRMETLMHLSTRLAEALVRQAAISEGERVLDVGTGTGNVALAAARFVGAQGRVIGVDLSSSMLAEARRKAVNLPVEFQEMDAESLEFGDATFDVVLSGLTLWFLPDVVRGMKQIYRVLRPGGRVAFSTYTPETFQPLRELMWKRLVQHGVPRLPAPAEPWMVLREPGHLLRLLEEAGFREPRVVAEPHVHMLRSGEEWWTFIRRSASWGELFDELPAEALESLKAEIIGDVEGLRTPDGIRVDTSALIGIGVRR